MMNKKVSLVIITILIMLSLNGLAIKISESQPLPTNAVLYMSPSVIADPTITPPAIVAVNVSVANVTNMGYCEFNLTYTPNIFYVVELAKQPVQGQTPSMYYEIEDYKGFVYVQLTYSHPVTVNGNGATLMILNFAIVDYGITPLHLGNAIMKDGDGNPIPFETQDGYLAIIKHEDRKSVV
jgi:hypothetical protein